MTIFTFCLLNLGCLFQLRTTVDTGFNIAEMKNKSDEELIIEASRLRTIANLLEVTVKIRTYTAQYKFLDSTIVKVTDIATKNVRQLSDDDEGMAVGVFVSSSSQPPVPISVSGKNSTDSTSILTPSSQSLSSIDGILGVLGFGLPR